MTFSLGTESNRLPACYLVQFLATAETLSEQSSDTKSDNTDII